MTEQTERIKKTLNTVTVDGDKLNQLCKDRLDFGFDSIYFRYSEAIEELSYFKEKEAHRSGEHYFDRKHFCDSRKMHFYQVLEQLLQAHIQE